MSTFNKNTLAVALVAALGFAANANAYTVDTAGDQNPVLVATADILSAATVVGINQALNITLDGNDTILGRTTGLSLRLDLSNGAQFAPGFDAADITIGPAGNNPVVTGTESWTATIAAGGAGQSFVVISINPPTSIPVPGLVAGELLQLDPSATIIPAGGDGFELRNLAPWLQTAGREITVTTLFRDPVSGNQITGMPVSGTTVLRSGNPLILDCDISAAANPAERIDVGVTPGQGSKTFFTESGQIGTADNGEFNAGDVTASVAPGFSFTYLSSDFFQTIVTGEFGAFNDGGGPNRVFLASDSTCATTLVTGAFADDNTIFFNYTGGSLGGNFSGAGFAASLCFEVGGGNALVIDDTTIDVQTTFSRGSFTFTDDSCALQPMLYNGSVVKVATIQGADNLNTQSLLRVTNPSSVSGLVYVDAWDDNGNQAPQVTFTLQAGESRTFSSAHLEGTNPNPALTGSFGDGSGRWRLLVTGEFANMRVQSLGRNATDGTITNLTDYDTNKEQVSPLFLGIVPLYEGSDPQ